MTRLLMTTALALSLAACQSPAAPTSVAPASSPAQQPAHAARENTNVLIIFFEQGKGDAVAAAAKQYGAEVVYRYQMMNGMAIRVPAGKDTDAAVKHFERVQGVLQVQRDQVMQLH
ncbi:S8 family serine peptidase [Kingella oralis]